jgi:hypothetical protein
MGTLKSTIKLESTDLFPTPVSFTVVNNNAVNGSFSGFNNLVASASAVALNIAPINSGVAYVYAQAPTTNGTAIYIQEAGGPTVFAVLAPGDVAFFPYGQTSAGGTDLEALTPGGTAQINYFVGEKA